MKSGKFRDLERETDNSLEIANNVIQGKFDLSDVFEGLNSDNSRAKFKSAKVLRTISEKKPDILYPYFDFFDDLMGSQNQIIKWNAIDIVANLTSVDADKKFERIFDKFYGLLAEGSLITSGHVVEKSAEILKTKKDLRDKVFKIILRVEAIPLPTEECRAIICGKMINVLSSSFDKIVDKKGTIDFVKRQLGSQRSGTRKKAETFLKKHPA